jgi:hypothetical protein
LEDISPVKNKINETGRHSIVRLENELLGPLVHLVNMSWFERMWIAQEVVLPPRATAIYGSIHSDWNLYREAAMRYHAHSHSCCLELMYKLSPGLDSVTSNFWLAISQFEEVGSQGSAVPFHRFMWRYCTRKCKDPHDKVYALLGLTEDPTIRREIVPDYSINMQALYAKLVRLCIDIYGDLDVLIGGLTNSRTMPSWIPDWTKADEQDPADWRSIFWRYETHQFDAAKGKRAQTACLNGVLLTTEALYFDKISTISSMFPEGGSAFARFHSAFESAITLLTPMGNRNWFESNNCNLKSTFLRTILRDSEATASVKQMRGVGPREKQLFDDYLTAFSKENVSLGWDFLQSREDLLSFDDLIGLSLSRQVFFVTDKGYMGVGDAEVGDEVYILSGGRRPFNLRAEPDTAHHRLISDCYVDGIMDGEAMVDWDEKKTTVTLC